MRKNKNTSKIIAAGIVAFAAMMLSYAYLNSMKGELDQKQQVIDIMQKTNTANDSDASYAYAVAAENLKAGEMVTDIDVDFKQFDTRQVDAFESRSEIVNKVLLKDITSGDVFTSAHIARISATNVELKEGYRALTVPLDNFQGKSTTMVPGSRVDLYNTSSNWTLEGAKIIGLEKSDSSPASNITGASSITFEVAAGDISDFITNISQGKTVIVARNANEKNVSYRLKRPKQSSGSASGSSSMGSLPNIPSAPPITNLSGLPQPMQPSTSPDGVEVIEANVKSKVTFE